MSALTLQDVLPPREFLARRASLEREVIAAKAPRRVPLGPHLTLLFENRATVLWQIQEMCRVEGITEPRAIQHELDTYNPLLPDGHTLSATLLLEFPEPEHRDQMTRRLVGLHEALTLEIDGAPPCRAVFDAHQFNEVRVASVHFVRFPLEPQQLAGFRDLGRTARFCLRHEAYEAEQRLAPSVRGALLEDLETA